LYSFYYYQLPIALWDKLDCLIIVHSGQVGFTLFLLVIFLSGKLYQASLKIYISYTK